MKKTFSKALSLLLVLAMLLSVVPMALATEDSTTPPEGSGEPTPTPTPDVATVTIDGPESAVLGETITVSVDVANYDASKFDVTYRWNQGTPGDTDTVTMKIEDAVNHTFYCTVSFTAKNPADEALTPAQVRSDSLTVAVTAVPTAITISANKSTITIGKNATTAQMTATTTPAGADTSALVWHSSDTSVATVSTSGEVTGVKAGTTKITATYGTGASAITSNEVTITVEEGTPEIKPISDLQVKKGDYDQVFPELTFKPASFTTGTTAQFKAEIATGDPVESNIVKITTATGTGLRFLGKNPGTERIKVTCTNVEGVDPVYFNVYVPAGDVTCTAQSNTAYNGSKVTLTPSYSASNTVDSYTFDIVKQTRTGAISKSVASNGKSCTFTLSGSYPAAAQVQIKAYDGETLVGECVSYVSFYLNNDVKVTMPDGAKTMSFRYATDNKENKHVADEMLYGLVSTTGSNIVSGYNVLISGLDTIEGTLSNISHSSAISATNLSQTIFTAGTYGSAAFYYTVVPNSDYGDMPLIRGYMEIDYDGSGDGDITYSTTYNKSVTVLERDFNEFWENYWEERNDRYYSDLEFVKFGSASDGKLYTSTSSTSSSYLASVNDQFYYGTYTKGTNKEDLGSLTFVPDSKKTYEYDVTIPFTAYGEETSESASGVVVIHVNESGNEITSRGTYIGTTYAKQIAENYKTAKGQNLSYVIFEVPDVEEVSLFFRVPEGSDGKGSLISKGQKVPYNQKLYYSTSNYTNDALSYVIVVPAAEYYGKITLKYTAYDSNGKNPYDGTLTYTVKQKTESDVFADMTRSYNWAYDSVDFLYYDEISQGSVKGYNRYYNPSANITRGDFMLMLYRAFLAEDYSDYNVKDNFNDMVKGNTEYSQETYHAVGVAKYLGISNGTNGKYNPKANITREEAMTLIYRTLEEMNRELEYDSNVSASSFKDYNKISAYAKTAISNLVGHGVIVGNNNNVNPKNNITRAEMACILHRVITY